MFGVDLLKGLRRVRIVTGICDADIESTVFRHDASDHRLRFLVIAQIRTDGYAAYFLGQRFGRGR